MILVLIIICIGSSFFYLRYKSEEDWELQRMFGDFFTNIGYCLWV